MYGCERKETNDRLIPLKLCHELQSRKSHVKYLSQLNQDQQLFLKYDPMWQTGKGLSLISGS